MIYDYMPNGIIERLEYNTSLLYIVVLPIVIFILYELIKLFFYAVNIVIMFPTLDAIESRLSGKSSIFKRFVSSFFEIPRALSYVIVLSFVFNIASILNVNKEFNNYLSKSKIYNSICKEIIIPIANSKLARQLPNIINNSFKIEIKQASNGSQSDNNIRTVIYYNGITLDEGVMSNEAIDNMAKSIVKGITDDNEKARALYEWVGSNIKYDNDKAEKILNNDFTAKSGAIAAFSEKKGICFDYSSLYVAMCRAVNIDVRLITGEGFNGVSWISHAWNQVYVNNKWINVDTTFYKGGNYYNSKRFNLDHKNASIAGEWPSDI